MRRNGRVTIAIGLERFTGICLREDMTVLDGGRTVAGTSVSGSVLCLNCHKK